MAFAETISLSTMSPVALSRRQVEVKLSLSPNLSLSLHSRFSHEEWTEYYAQLSRVALDIHVLTSVEFAPVAQDRGIIVGQGRTQFSFGGGSFVGIHDEAEIEMQEPVLGVLHDGPLILGNDLPVID